MGLLESALVVEILLRSELVNESFSEAVATVFVSLIDGQNDEDARIDDPVFKNLSVFDVNGPIVEVEAEKRAADGCVNFVWVVGMVDFKGGSPKVHFCKGNIFIL